MFFVHVIVREFWRWNVEYLVTNLRSNCCSKVHAVMWPDKLSTSLQELDEVVFIYQFPSCRSLQNGDLLHRSSKWRLPCPIFFRSIKMAHACDAHSPQPSSKPSTPKLKTPTFSYPSSPTLSPSPLGTTGREAAASLLALAVARPLPTCHPAVVLLAATQRFTACLNDIH